MMVANNEFKMYNKAVSYNKYIREYVISTIPSIHRDLRIHLLDESYSLIKLLMSASFSKGNIRNKYINDVIIVISMNDYLLGEIGDINNNKKVCLSAIKLLADVKNMVYAWKSNIDNESNK